MSRHNGSFATGAKVTLRRNVLAHVTPAHVFDAFCGPTGEMWRAAWKSAASYVGVDEAYELWDERRRFVGDNRTVMRSIDLGAFNVFDLDAFAEPWEQLAILSARRTWKAGERGAVVLTWNNLKTRWDGASHALAFVAGMTDRHVRGDDASDLVTERAVRGFLRRSRVKPVKIWRAEGQSAKHRISTGAARAGSMMMHYLAVVFDGLGPAS